MREAYECRYCKNVVARKLPNLPIRRQTTMHFVEKEKKNMLPSSGFAQLEPMECGQKGES
jgi:hypothetical protein